MCIMSVYRPTLLKVVGSYDLSVLCRSVMVSKKVWILGELYPRVFWDFLNFFNFAKPLRRHRCVIASEGLPSLTALDGDVPSPLM